MIALEAAKDLQLRLNLWLAKTGATLLLVDGIIGAKTLAAVTALALAAHAELVPDVEGNHVMASSFADPSDVTAFRHCKANGGTDQQCYRVGDSGVGFWGDDCTASKLFCALPPEDWLAKWGSKEDAHLKPVVVTANGLTITCLLADTMPHKANIKNHAGLDLSPASCKALGLTPPVMTPATWTWA